MSIFGAIGGLLGGLFQNSAANKRQRQMLQWQEQMDNTKIQRLQRDAKAAGVHPLAAMGTSLTSPSPVAVGGHPDFSDMGQNVGRAVDATMSGPQKADDYTKTVQALTVDRMNLENNVIRNQLANSAARTVNQAGNSPTFHPAGNLPQNTRDMSERAEEILKIFGYEIPNHPDFSAANVVQNQWGEPAEIPYAFLKVPADLAHRFGWTKYKGRRKVSKEMLDRDREVLRRKSFKTRRDHSYYW